MKGMKFEAASSIQQTVTRELKAIWEKAFFSDMIHCMSDVNVVHKEAGTIMSDGIDKYFLSFLRGFYGLSSGT
jgi:hypothetical protein